MVRWCVRVFALVLRKFRDALARESVTAMTTAYIRHCIGFSLQCHTRRSDISLWKYAMQPYPTFRHQFIRQLKVCVLYK